MKLLKSNIENKISFMYASNVASIAIGILVNTFILLMNVAMCNILGIIINGLMYCGLGYCVGGLVSNYKENKKNEENVKRE